MEEMGFRHHKSFEFSRVNDIGMHQIIGSQILSSKIRVRLWPNVWVPEFDPDVTPEKYPPNEMWTSFSTWDRPEWRDLWPIENESEIVESLRGMLALVRSEVVPWFDAVQSGTELIQVIAPNLRESEAVARMTPTLLARYGVTSRIPTSRKR